MTNEIDSFWDGLSELEAGAMENILREHSEVRWSRRVFQAVNKKGRMVRANKALFFELRFGYALHHVGIEPEYEITGEGSSTVDFGFMSRDQKWRVELMRLEETQAATDATRGVRDDDGVYWSGRMLSSDAGDPKRSPAGEMYKAVERICQKCERNGHPHKFPLPDGSFHAILVDFRTFLTSGGDEHDRVHVALGGEAVRAEYRHFLSGDLISGVFSPPATH